MTTLNDKGINQANTLQRSSLKIPDWIFPTCAVIVVITALVWVTPIAVAYISGEPIPSKVRNNSDRPLWFVVHVVTGSYALLLGALQMHQPLRNSHRNLHRLFGRVYVGLVIVSALTSLSLDPRLTIYGTEILRPLAAALWLGTTALGVIAIRRRDISSHRRWMIRSYALAYMGITFLILSGLGKNIGLPIEVRYPLVIWLSLLLNVAIAEIYIFRTAHKSSDIASTI